MQLVVEYVGDRLEHPRPVRALVDRPHGLRVEELDGALVTASWSEHPWGTGWDDDGAGPVERTMHGPHDARAAAPLLRADGLVARRPVETRHLRYDDPMFQTYRWVAMLDPVELADGGPPADEAGVSRPTSPAWSPIALDGVVREVDHAGRAAWEATVLTTDRYQPRCACCPALDGAHSRERDRWEQGLAGQADPDRRQRALSHRVRLDVGTGILVLSQEQGGDADGRGWHASIEDVDADLPRSAFG